MEWFEKVPDDGKYPHTPCDYMDEDGHYHCPFIDTYGGAESEMCRNCCGLGVDE